jgi:hypothetical protein
MYTEFFLNKVYFLIQNLFIFSSKFVFFSKKFVFLRYHVMGIDNVMTVPSPYVLSILISHLLP